MARRIFSSPKFEDVLRGPPAAYSLYPVGSGTYPRSRVARSCDDHWSPSSGKVKNKSHYTFTPSWHA